MVELLQDSRKEMETAKAQRLDTPSHAQMLLAKVENSQRQTKTAEKARSQRPNARQCVQQPGRLGNV